MKTLKNSKKDGWKQHKQFVHDGVNPMEIAKVIRNDELEKFQEISSQSNFDFNQTITPLFMNDVHLLTKKMFHSLIIQHFFGSIKCFHFLLMKGSKLDNTFK